MRVPITPDMYASWGACSRAMAKAVIAAMIGGTNAGMTIPMPLTGLLSRYVATVVTAVASTVRVTGTAGTRYRHSKPGSMAPPKLIAMIRSLIAGSLIPR